MRVAKTDLVAGVPAPLARNIVRKFRGRPAVADVARQLLEESVHAPDAIVADLAAAGYLVKVETDNDGDVWWESTIEGNSLAMVSFGKPIHRKTADRLAAGWGERAESYNADAGKPLFIDRLRIFAAT